MKDGSDIYKIYSPQLCMNCINKKLQIDYVTVGYRYDCSIAHTVRISGHCKGYICDDELKAKAEAYDKLLIVVDELKSKAEAYEKLLEIFKPFL